MCLWIHRSPCIHPYLRSVNTPLLPYCNWTSQSATFHLKILHTKTIQIYVEKLSKIAPLSCLSKVTPVDSMFLKIYVTLTTRDMLEHKCGYNLPCRHNSRRRRKYVDIPNADMTREPNRQNRCFFANLWIVTWKLHILKVNFVIVQ